MKTLDEKAAEYSAKLCNQSGNYSKGELETAYVLGANESKYLQYGECGTFGQALEELKQGRLVTRKGWNGKGMFIFMRPADELHVGFVAKDIKSLPQGVKDYYHQDCVDENGKLLDLAKEDVVKFTAYLCMKAADGTIVNGWLASQTDMLSEDWMIFK
ncbi:DUF2829 domain-containing protein [Dysgonomonas gadei]|uniref:Thoeris anti-defense 2-like domain-containing protein n=1 Tax=Dysgonomonas gadei ATCC BAA-286 TaxID=742766 RepID=F5J171_9BACT|nr:DUF2829 domain-containing protein [Dysgonomonas gadei]EGK00445.1 hypothetical protein HMPREF9455_03088 [Dysgonomonas gadei ATCC BAA-286]